MQQITNGVTNLFVHRSAAQRYAAARPYFHPLVVSRIAGFTATSRVDRALDIACGTGQSARALAAVAERVDAVDVSPEMVTEAQPHEQVRYHVAAAERLPFADASFDLATVGLAFHWFDQAAFLTEVRRVLKPTSWLAVYNSGFYGEMAEDAGFRTWARIAYPARFPTPARRSFGVGGELAAACGFSLVGEESFTHDEVMTAEQLTAYLLTQTNVIAAVESGGTPLPEVAAWILSGVKPFFSDASATMKFGGTIWFLRRTAVA